MKLCHKHPQEVLNALNSFGGHTQSINKITIFVCIQCMLTSFVEMVQSRQRNPQPSVVDTSCYVQRQALRR